MAGQVRLIRGKTKSDRSLLAGIQIHQNPNTNWSTNPNTSGRRGDEKGSVSTCRIAQCVANLQPIIRKEPNQKLYFELIYAKLMWVGWSVEKRPGAGRPLLDYGAAIRTRILCTNWRLHPRPRPAYAHCFPCILKRLLWSFCIQWTLMLVAPYECPVRITCGQF